ncbi:hypothetical protein GFS24_04095 [Chitinophaga sp. SYP-B3965]|uniref:hypothetical protein n=1 Tax=Chitinophaga sp. SYP-B3965 TaxID=2663120 RepID=UPI001299A47C|nr:hypothetical protein [Chitinophaga sp. SYP-B3965]MRG44279.1 hypothetical protein [Chitinophaga sp. SYP-B3965]
MIAYNKTDLENSWIQQDAKDACLKECITKEENKNIKAQYPTGLYTPNIFIRIGLFLATVVVGIFSLGLISLIMASSLSEETFGGISIFFALVCYGCLELIVKEKKHFGAGVDEALMWMAGGLMLTGFLLLSDGNFDNVALYVLVFLLGGFFALRFLDSLMAVVSFIGLLSVLFYITYKLGPIAKLIMPFVVMIASLLVYLAVTRLSKKATNRPYFNCLNLVSIASLVTLYIGGNYFVVREVGNEMFGMQLTPEDSIPGAFIFWTFTAIIPIIYIIMGIRKKDSILIRTGLVLVGAIVFTVRYYHSIMPIEGAMTIGGILMIGLAYGVIQYLKQPKHGFTYEEEQTEEGAIQLESLVIAQTMSATPQRDESFKFGGGTGGGGGASDSY